MKPLASIFRFAFDPFRRVDLHFVSICVCSNPEFSSEIEMSRLEKNMGPNCIWNSVPKLDGNHTPSSCRW